MSCEEEQFSVEVASVVIEWPQYWQISSGQIRTCVNHRRRAKYINIRISRTIYSLFSDYCCHGWLTKHVYEQKHATRNNWHKMNKEWIFYFQWLQSISASTLCAIFCRIDKNGTAAFLCMTNTQIYVNIGRFITYNAR